MAFLKLLILCGQNPKHNFVHLVCSPRVCASPSSVEGKLAETEVPQQQMVLRWL